VWRYYDWYVRYEWEIAGGILYAVLLLFLVLALA